VQTSALGRHAKKLCSEGLHLLLQFWQCSAWKRFKGENGESLLSCVSLVLVIVLSSFFKGFLEKINDPDRSRNFASVLVYSLK